MMKSDARDTGKLQAGEGSYDSWPESVQVDDFLHNGNKLIGIRDLTAVLRQSRKVNPE
ncbi:MAG: hypothetical protein GY703_12500 [Gammaproteobacteria bacterium]|nr:hypothetical protein [Gammaproteobacteria bacterium]